MTNRHSNTGLGDIISTGIDGEIIHGSKASVNKPQDTFVEIPLPFFYLFYAMDKPFSLSIGGVKVRCNKNEGVFVKKSVPFSVLLTWDGHGLERTDICAARFSTEIISTLNVCYDNNFTRLKDIEVTNPPVPDYVFFDFYKLDKAERTTLQWMVLQVVEDNILSKKNSEDNNFESCKKVKCHFILNHLIKYNPAVCCIFHSSSVNSISEKVANLIIKDYSVNWSIEKMANTLLISSSTLKKKMYDDVGSIADFTHRIKLTEALRRLRRTNDSISSIAEALGYCSNSYFSSCFKKYFKLHPSDVRKKTVKYSKR